MSVVSRGVPTVDAHRDDFRTKRNDPIDLGVRGQLSNGSLAERAGRPGDRNREH